MLITLNTFYDHLSLTFKLDKARVGVGSTCQCVRLLVDLHVCEFVFDVNNDELCF